MVATAQTGGTLYCRSMKDIDKGSRNRHSPVILFAAECRDTVVRRVTNTRKNVQTFMVAIMQIHPHSQAASRITGRNFRTDTAIKTRSATVSSMEPNAVTAFIFLAMLPSTISDKLQNRYST